MIKTFSHQTLLSIQCMRYFNLLTIFLFTTLLLTACGGDKIETDNPELVSVAFFNALYNEKDVKKAASFCGPKLSKLILHYRSPKAVGRHLFNMSYDSVEIKPEDSGVKIREQFKSKAEITLYFKGVHLKNKIKDIKRLSLIQVKGKWLIDKVLKDPF